MPRTHQSVVATGDMLVTGRGEIILDEELPQDPELDVVVEFDPCEPAPPCVGPHGADVLDWELVVKHHQGGHQPDSETLRLKITWKTRKARTIIWRVYK